MAFKNLKIRSKGVNSGQNGKSKIGMMFFDVETRKEIGVADAIRS